MVHRCRGAIPSRAMAHRKAEEALTRLGAPIPVSKPIATSEPERWRIYNLGSFRMKDLPRPEPKDCLSSPPEKWLNWLWSRRQPRHPPCPQASRWVRNQGGEVVAGAGIAVASESVEPLRPKRPNRICQRRLNPRLSLRLNLGLQYHQFESHRARCQHVLFRFLSRQPPSAGMSPQWPRRGRVARRAPANRLSRRV